MSGPVPVLKFSSACAMDNPKMIPQHYAELKEAIHTLLVAKHTSRSISFNEYYTKSYFMVIGRAGRQLYDGLIEILKKHLHGKIRQDAIDSLDEGCLETVNCLWSDYKESLVLIQDILMFLDRVYIMYNNLEHVYNLGILSFRDCVIYSWPVGEKLTHLMLNTISRERRGEVTDREEFKKLCQMLMALGIEKNQLNATIDSRNVYEQVFEKPFIQQSTAIFKADADKYLSSDLSSTKPATNGSPTYLETVEQHLIRERKIAETCLDASSKAVILRVLYEQLVMQYYKNHQPEHQIISMIQNRRYEDLAAFYKLSTLFDEQLPNGTETMLQQIGQHFLTLGYSLITENDNSSKSPEEFVTALLQLKDEYDKFLVQSFDGDVRYEQMISEALQNVLKLNNRRSAEYLSLFVHHKLKKGSRDEVGYDLDNVLDGALTLFRFLPEKDMFKRYYKQHLAKRLLSNRYISEDCERLMLDKLKLECGTQFTGRLECLFKDLQLCKILNDEYRQLPIQNAGFLHVHVLSPGKWPMNFRQENELILPDSERVTFAEFKKYYESKHDQRRLSLQPCYGSAEITAHFSGPTDGSAGSSSQGPRKCTLQVSTYQMVVLLLFNDQKEWSVQDMEAATRISNDDLKVILNGLGCGKRKLILKTSSGNEIDYSSTFVINDSFQCRSARVNMVKSAGQKNEMEKERVEPGVATIEENRKQEIESVIVRVMKSRKMLQHSQLVAEVIKQLHHRFIPDPQAIVKRIKVLLEREYLSTSPTDRLLYQYSA